MHAPDDIRKYCRLRKYSPEYAEYAVTHRFCEACGDGAALPHHIRTRGAHGDNDAAWNLLGLCHAHHRMIHDIGYDAFCGRFPLVADKVRAALERTVRA